LQDLALFSLHHTLEDTLARFRHFVDVEGERPVERLSASIIRVIQQLDGIPPPEAALRLAVFD
jgi:hypothetical protein